MNNLGRRVYGLGAIALGLIGLVWRDFALVWQPVPADFPHRMDWALAFGAALLLAGLAANVKRTVALGCGALMILYTLCVLLLHAPRVAAHPLAFGPWQGLAEQLALASAGAIALAGSVRMGATASARLARFGRTAFAICLVIFGLAHFVYLSFTAAMVPHWLPPNPRFWTYATGAFHIAAGLALLFGVRARLAAVMLTAMFTGFGVLVHAPLLLADPTSHLNWTGNAMNLALIGAAWVVADSLGRRR